MVISAVGEIRTAYFVAFVIAFGNSYEILECVRF